MLNLSIKSFVNTFVDIDLNFFDISFNSFLFDVTSFSLLLNLSYFRNSQYHFGLLNLPVSILD